MKLTLKKVAFHAFLLLVILAIPILFGLGPVVHSVAP
jgi:hypothetical protein